MSVDLGARAAEIDGLVTGWMTAIMRHTPLDGSEPLNGLGPSDFQRVRAGYGCPRCLAKFKTYLPVCPVCRYERDVALDVVAPPADWVASLDEYNSVEGTPVSMDEFIGEVMRDPDIEQRRL